MREQPQVFASMQADYAAYARANGVVDVPQGYDPQHQTARNALMAQFGYYWWALALTALTPETIGVRWVPADAVVTLPLHPGFAATWNVVRTLL